MKFSIITLFPELIKNYTSESIIKRAINNKKIELEIIDIRDFTTLSHNQVDDYQAGGGSGMVLMVEPVVRAIEFCKTNDALVIMTTPKGKVWKQQLAKQFSKTKQHLIILCGHYEGFDERIMNYVDLEISVGDFVLTGGELPALTLLDSITRLIPGVINKESHENDSFENNLLDYPVYTKPNDFRGQKIPEVLLSGHHKNIKDWREEQQLLVTLKNRPDLIDESELTISQLKILKKMKGEN